MYFQKKKYRELFGYEKRILPVLTMWTMLLIDPVSGAEVEIIFANNPKAILDYTKSILTCDIHSRERTKRILNANGAEKVYALDDIIQY